MEEMFTQEKKDEKKSELSNEKMSPSQETLNFIRMFAYSYHTEPSLPTALNAACLN